MFSKKRKRNKGILFFSTALIAASTAHGFCGGTGTTTDPYLICTPIELDSVRNDPKASYKVNVNLNLRSLHNFQPLPRFYGDFNGNGKLISNLTINSTNGDDVALFLILAKEGRIHDVNLRNFRIAGLQIAATLVAFNEAGTIDRCTGTGTVSGFTTGGLIGFLSGGTLAKSSFNGTVTGQNETGGLIGSATFGEISQSFSAGRVRGRDSIGGLVGRLIHSRVFNSFSTATVTTVGSDTVAGGLAGEASRSEISFSYATGRLSGASAQLGGLVGRHSGATALDSFWDLGTTRVATSPLGSGLTTAEMKTASNFPDTWSRSIWTFARRRYPALRP